MSGQHFQHPAPAFAAACLAVLCWWGGSGHAGSQEGNRERLQELLQREALFYHHQKDYFTAITHLESARESQPEQEPPTEAELLLVRMKLAFGVHEDADRVLRRLRADDIPEAQANTAWYELAETLFRKGYPGAANEALDSLRGRVPEDIAGNVQLLRANVLMALRRYAEAARALENWRGPRALAGYAHFNRGIALLRADNEPEAVSSLRLVADARVEDEEGLALKDRANLTLGYIALRSEELGQARKHFDEVRREGPYSNRALLATGLVEQAQGRPDQALSAWMALRQRALADPAVQESYLAVPYALREQQAPQAAHGYEQAVASFSRELEDVNLAREAVQEEKDLDRLLRNARAPGAVDTQRDETSAKALESRYLGRLMASRRFQETSLGHRDLLAMLADLDQNLQDMDQLADVEPQAVVERKKMKERASRRAADPGAEPDPGPAGDRADHNRRAAAQAPSSEALEWQQAPAPERPSRDIPVLPEIESPPEADYRPLPNSDPTGLPGSEVIWLPAAPEVIGADDIDRLPLAPDVVWLPPASSFRPITHDDFAYPDLALPEESYGDPTRHLPRRTTEAGADSDVPPDIGLGENPLDGLSAALGRTNDRIAQIARKARDRRSGVKDYRALIEALQQRARRLRERIAAAIALYERYAKALIIDELEDRRSRLEDYLQQARLELAKTYDLDTDLPR
ncbi:MAG: hypothetical protein WBR56_00735 [Sedimenticolaceae bacterium]